MRPFLFLLALALAAPAGAQRLPARLRPATLNTPAALQRAALELFRPGRGVVLELKLARRRMEHALACEVETWAVASEEGGPLGSFVRLRSWPLPDCSVDLAVRIEDGKVRAVAALKPVVLAGAAFPALPAALARVTDAPVATWAPLAARLFAALPHVEASLRGRSSPAAPGAEVAAVAIDALEKLRPALLPGAEFPQLEVPDENGARFGAERFEGRGALFVAASVKHADSRALIERLERYAAARRGRFALIWVLADRPAAIAAYRERGGTLDGLVVPDPSRTVREALRVSVLPSLFAFDAKKKLVGYMRAPWPDEDGLAEVLDALPLTSAPASVAATAAVTSPAAAPGWPVADSDRLAAAGRKLLKLGAKDELVVAADRGIERWTDGWALQRLEARDGEGNVLGTLARVTVLGERTSRLDLALTMERGAIAGVEPLAPVLAGGREVPQLAELVLAVGHRPAEQPLAALSRVMEGLAAAARPAAPKAAERLAVRIATPGLKVGDALPEIQGNGADGKLVPASALKGRAGLVVVTDRAPAPELVRAAVGAAAGRPDLTVLFVVAGTAGEARAAVPAAQRVLVIADADGRVAGALKAPHAPYLYGVSRRGEVVARGSWSGVASVRAVLPPAAR